MLAIVAVGVGGVAFVAVACFFNSRKSVQRRFLLVGLLLLLFWGLSETDQGTAVTSQSSMRRTLGCVCCCCCCCMLLLSSLLLLVVVSLVLVVVSLVVVVVAVVVAVVAVAVAVVVVGCCCSYGYFAFVSSTATVHSNRWA